MAWRRLDGSNKSARRSRRRRPRIRQHLDVNSPVHAVVSQSSLRARFLRGRSQVVDHPHRPLGVVHLARDACSLSRARTQGRVAPAPVISDRPQRNGVNVVLVLWAPRHRPMSVLAVATPGAHVWTRHGPPVLSSGRAVEAVLHVAPQPIVCGQRGYFGRVRQNPMIGAPFTPTS